MHFSRNAPPPPLNLELHPICALPSWPRLYQTLSVWSIVQGSSEKHSPVYVLYLCLNRRNFVSSRRVCPFHKSQNFMTVGTKCKTSEPVPTDPWSLDQPVCVWWRCGWRTSLHSYDMHKNRIKLMQLKPIHELNFNWTQWNRTSDSSNISSTCRFPWQQATLTLTSKQLSCFLPIVRVLLVKTVLEAVIVMIVTVRMRRREAVVDWG